MSEQPDQKLARAMERFADGSLTDFDPRVDRLSAAVAEIEAASPSTITSTTCIMLSGSW